MGRPRAVSAADMARTLECLTRAGIMVGEVIVEPGRVRIVPKALADEAVTLDTLAPKEWPSE